MTRILMLKFGCFLAAVFLLQSGSMQIMDSTGNWRSVPVCGNGQTLRSNGTTWSCGSAIAAGTEILVASGSCPVGWTEDDTGAGGYLLVTTSTNGDAGGTGGSNSYTPAGSVSQPELSMNPYTPAGSNGAVSFTPAGTNAWPASVPTFTGTANQSTSSVSAGTPAGTNGTTTLSYTGTKFSTSSGATYAPTALGGTTIGASGSITVSAETFTGTAMGTHSHTFTPSGTIAWPANPETFTGTQGTVPAETFAGNAATLTGTVSQPGFSGSQATLQPAYYKVIACKAS